MSKWMKLVTVLLVWGTVGCGGEVAKLSEIETEIFQPACAFSSCHDTASAQAGLSLESETYQALVNVASTQDTAKMRVVPSQLAASYLINKIENREVIGMEMPPGQMLSAERLERIRSWIEAGAKDD